MPFRSLPRPAKRTKAPAPERSGSLFATGASGNSSTHSRPGLTAHIDGGARGNPGPAGYGVHLQDASGKLVAELSQYLGHRTNNYAEYAALLAALEYALAHGHAALSVVSDSELLVKQMRGEYKVKSPDLRILYDQARKLIARLEAFNIRHVLRAKNRDADRLANAAMDAGTGVPPAAAQPATEFAGVVRDGRIEFSSGTLPEGTRVRIKVTQ